VTINDRDSDLDTYFCIVVKVAVFNLRVFFWNWRQQTGSVLP